MGTNYWAYTLIGKKYSSYEEMPEDVQNHYDNWNYEDGLHAGDFVIIGPGNGNDYYAGYLLGKTDDFRYDIGVEIEGDWKRKDIDRLFDEAKLRLGDECTLLFDLYVG